MQQKGLWFFCYHSLLGYHCFILYILCLKCLIQSFLMYFQISSNFYFALNFQWLVNSFLEKCFSYALALSFAMAFFVGWNFLKRRLCLDRAIFNLRKLDFILLPQSLLWLNHRKKLITVTVFAYLWLCTPFFVLVAA
jgi:hypothetical protein